MINSTVFAIFTIFLVFLIHFETSVEGIRLSAKINENLNTATKDVVSSNIVGNMTVTS